VNKEEWAEQDEEFVALKRVFSKGRISAEYCKNINPKRKRDI
jgi:hypothetical protein